MFPLDLRQHQRFRAQFQFDVRVKDGGQIPSFTVDHKERMKRVHEVILASPTRTCTIIPC